MTAVSWVKLMAAVHTYIPAKLTADTPAVKKLNIGAGRDGFRIMAPEAAHGAAFEKNRRADSRSVMQGHPLYIKYCSVRLIFFHNYT